MHARWSVLALICAAVMSAPPTALAGAPERSPIDVTFSGADTVCGFPDVFTFHEYGTVSTFVDNTGSQPSALAHLHADVTVTANGITLVERDTFAVTFNQDGTTRTAGLTTHIQGPGGLVLRDAGSLVLLPNPDPNLPPTVIAVHGPHPQFFGADFCSALM
jgi:hypothetical protein